MSIMSFFEAKYDRCKSKNCPIFLHLYFVAKAEERGKIAKVIAFIDFPRELEARASEEQEVLG